MRTILWTTPTLGQVLHVRDHCNHIVLRVSSRTQREIRFNWVIQQDDGMYQVGFTLKTPVRLTPFPDGNSPREKPQQYLRAVVSTLEKMYQGVQILDYFNPSHPDCAAQGATEEDLQGRTLNQLGGKRGSKVMGGRSTSEKKIQSSRRNLERARERHNETVRWLANNRWERLLHYQDLGMTQKEMAEKEGCSIASIKQALYRARKAQEADQARIDKAHEEWLEEERAKAPTEDLHSIRIENADGSVTVIQGEPASVEELEEAERLFKLLG